ncbi:MAG: GTP 3',8-cyclase MoaA [Lutimonas sp.]
MLQDSFGRNINYLRLAVTDRCNLRCQYCMPAHGIDIVDRKDLLTFKEIYRIIRVLSELGVDKVRLTGGEPFVRKDFISLLESLAFNEKLKQISITTNGVLISKYIPKLEELGIHSVNLSLDTLKKDRFKTITRRDLFDQTMETFYQLVNSNIKLKLNVVVQSGVNTDEIIDFVRLSKEQPIAVRFIEEMPFNGKGQRATEETWDYTHIFNHIKNNFSDFEKLPDEMNGTSKNFKLVNSLGSFGIIPAFTRTICSDCNRIRLTATGLFKNCLFDDGVFNLRDFIRAGASDDDIKKIFQDTILKKPENGFVAEKNRKSEKVSESMSTIGG